MKRYIAEGLARFLEENPMAWHMPGHKRIWTGLNSEGGPIDDALAKAICMDVTEVPGTDDLYEPTEMIAKSMQELTKVYKTYSSYYLVNGSTGGILSAIATVAECRRGKIIVAENCHKSVFNGVKLMGLEPIYLSPDLSEITVGETSGIKISSDIKADRVEEICRTEKIAAMIITSPTYEGVVSDVQAIADILHRYGALLIVDEAHGAHLPFVAGLPKSALYCGADIVVQSLHKTLPALTQTAILHVNNSEIDLVLKEKLQIFMSSSPSYIFLCSMEAAIVWACGEMHGEFINALNTFRKKTETFKNLHVLSEKDIAGAGMYAYDSSRIVLVVDECCGLTGVGLEELLRERENVAVEMCGINYVVLISTIADDVSRFEELFERIKRIDNFLNIIDKEKNMEKLTCNSDKKLIEHKLLTDKLQKLVGTVAPDNMYVYPPGSYVVRKGELITDKAAGQLMEYLSAGLQIRGL